MPQPRSGPVGAGRAGPQGGGQAAGGDAAADSIRACWRRSSRPARRPASCWQKMPQLTPELFGGAWNERVAEAVRRLERTATPCRGHRRCDRGRCGDRAGCRAYRGAGEGGNLVVRASRPSVACTAKGVLLLGDDNFKNLDISGGAGVGLADGPRAPADGPGAPG